MTNKVTNLAEKFAANVSRREFFSSLGMFSAAAAAVGVLSGSLKAQPLSGKSLKCCYACPGDGALVTSVRLNQDCPAGTIAWQFNNMRACPTGIACPA